MSRWLGALGLVAWSLAAGAADDAGLAGCDAGFADAPESYDAAMCFYTVAAATGTWEQAGARLRELEREFPDIAWLRLVRAHVAWSIGHEQAEELYRDAASAFADDGNLHGELVALSNLRTLLFRAGRVSEATAQVERIGEIGELTGDDELRVRALVDQAGHDIDRGVSLSRAQGTLVRARAALTDRHPYWLHIAVLNRLGLLHLHFGQFQEAVVGFRRVAEIAQQHDDLPGLALARFNQANATYEMLVETPRAEGRIEALRLAETALETARQAKSDHVEVVTHRLLAELLMADDPHRARQHADRCRALAERLSEPGVLSECLWSQARLVAAEDPGAATELIGQAVALMERHDDAERLGHAWRHHMRISWQTRPLADAIADSERALDVFESLRDLQADEYGRVGVLSAWARDYYWLSGRLLEQAEQHGDPALLARAFRVTERMRARALLESLQSEVPVVLDDERARERQAVLGDIVELNRQLLQAPATGPAAAAPSRARILKDLAALELRERELSDALALQVGTAMPATPAFADLSAVQHALADDEALLSFQIGSWQDVSKAFGGGAWLMVITHDAVRTVRLPGRTELADSLAVALEPIRSERLPVTSQVALHRRLFGDSLDRLGEHVRRLVVIGDYPFHHFPLGALRRTAAGPPLAVEYQLSFVPSATLWRNWRETAGQAAGATALVLANPSLGGPAAVRSAEWRSWALDSGLELGPLPHAEAEGRQVLARLHGSGTLLTGADASEAALKHLDLAEYGILHFASHAVVDQLHPERSAVVLAAGSADQDGLLQVREIVDLPLDGQVVVLSACQTATGTHVRGEGVQGLARAFFAAGVEVVIGSLWPMRDDHAAAFFDAFYRSLGESESVGAALQTAQRRLQAAGMPAEAWAGFQVIGDADVTPFAGSGAGRYAATGSVLAVYVVLAALGFLVACGLFRQRYRILEHFPRRRSALRLSG